MTSSATPLDNDASKLNLSLNGNYQIPIKSLDMYEKQLRETLRMLSHTDVFSFAAFKCLRQESLNPKMLSQILESLSLSVKHAVGMVSFLTVELQQTRRDAAIQSAAKSLSLEAKNQLRNIPIASKTLFGGQIDSIYKENSEVNRNKLITKAVALNRGISLILRNQYLIRILILAIENLEHLALTLDQEVDVLVGVMVGWTELSPLVEGPPLPVDSENLPPLPLPQPQIPVGGRLAHFALNWQNITNDQLVLSLIKNGYQIPFKEQPPLSREPIFFQQSQRRELEEEVTSLLQKGAVEEIQPETPGFYSRIFLVPKKNGKLRLIIDLSTLNKYVFVQSFRMETQRKVRNTIRQNDWAFSLNLTDAYLHVPIHPRSRKYLRFTLKGRVFHFRALPFGLSTSPYIFTLLMTVIATYLRRRAIILHPYLDDWLSRNQSRLILLEHRHFIIQLITSLGLIINQEKSDLIPTQMFTFIGMEFLTHMNIVRVPQARVQILLETVKKFSQKTYVSAQEFLSLLGQLNAAADFVMQITSQTIANVSACSMEATNITASTSNKVDGGCSTLSKLVETTSALPSRCSYEGRSSISSHFLGCQSNRLGFTSGAGRTSVSWSLVQNPIPTPHQYFRNDGHFIDTEEGSSIHKELHGSHINRQHNSSSIFEPSGGDTFTRPLHGSLENSNMVSSEPNKSSDKTFRGNSMFWQIG